MSRAFSRAAIVAAGLLLAACSDGLTFNAPRQNTGVPVFAILDGAVSVRGPDGFCVDTSASRPALGFAVLTTCGLISDSATVPAIEGLITVQVGAEGSAVVTGSEGTLSDLLQSGPGVQMLAAHRNPDSITLDRVFSRPGIVVVHFSDTAPPVVDGLEHKEWRAFFDLDGRLATVSIRGLSRAPLQSDSGLVLLDQAVLALQSANRDET